VENGYSETGEEQPSVHDTKPGNAVRLGVHTVLVRDGGQFKIRPSKPA
jgi:hypothetical protein